MIFLFISIFETVVYKKLIMGVCTKAPEPLPPIPPVTKENVASVLQLCYEQKIAPLERRHCFEMFHTPPVMPAEFKAKPMVLFLGQVRLISKL